MTTKTTANVLRAVTQRVLDSFTAQGALFTALDVSNVVKSTLTDVRHRDIAPSCARCSSAAPWGSTPRR